MRNVRSHPVTVFLLALAPALVGACSADDDKPGADAASVLADANLQGTADAATTSADAQAGDFTLTSSSIVEGGSIAVDFSCEGDNISPALAWANPPEGTQAFALVFTDLSINFLHSAMWDISVSQLELPEDVEKVFEPSEAPGAKQPNSYAGTRGYAGPCPGAIHTYEFRIHAVDTAELSGLSQQSTRAQVVAAIEAASLGSAALSATFDPN